MSQERGWKPHNALRYELLRYLEKLFVDICSLATSLFRPQRPQIWLRWGEMGWDVYLTACLQWPSSGWPLVEHFPWGWGYVYGSTYYMIPRNPIPRQYSTPFYGPSHIVSLVPTSPWFLKVFNFVGYSIFLLYNIPIVIPIAVYPQISPVIRLGSLY